jgi:S-formylglutathione hydrolase FrmB
VVALATQVGAPTAYAQVPPPSNAAAAPARRGTVRTDTLWSQSLGLMKTLTVYLPPSYSASTGTATQRYPVLFYLHGYSGNERNWVDVGHLDRTLDSLAAAGHPEAIVVMPDGDDSWYTTWGGLADMPACRADTVRKESADSYCVPWQHYDDYVAHDLVTYVDGHYRTRADRQHRGIAGLSMGGYGAVALALAYPEVFAAAASHSGVLSPRFLGPVPFAEPARYANSLADMEQASRGLWKSIAQAFGRDTIAWGTREPRQLAARLAARQAPTGQAPTGQAPTGQAPTAPSPTAGAVSWPQLLIDCGVDDPYLSQNRDFHASLQRLGVAHRYAEWPGAHTWGYWTTHSAQSLEFLLGVVGSR